MGKKAYLLYTTSVMKTLSEEYRKQQQELHKNPNYGVASIGYASTVLGLMKQTGAKSLSDYGAGKCRLWDKLEELGCDGVEYYPYDPAFSSYGAPKSADLVCCIDVLEHIEPEYLDAVLQDLNKIVTKYGFFTIHTGPAVKTLEDGRNAHLIQEPASWWLPKMCKYFEIANLQRSQGGFFIVVEKKA